MAKYRVRPVDVFYCMDCLEKDHSLVLHDDLESYCPVCGAHPDRQDFALKDENGDGVEDIDSDHPLALEMLYQIRMRLFRRAVYNAPLSTINDMIFQLMEIKTYRADGHPEPQGIRSGLMGDKLKVLQEIKLDLLIDDKPEKDIEITEGPIY